MRALLQVVSKPSGRPSRRQFSRRFPAAKRVFSRALAIAGLLSLSQIGCVSTHCASGGCATSWSQYPGGSPCCGTENSCGADCATGDYGSNCEDGRGCPSCQPSKLTAPHHHYKGWCDELVSKHTAHGCAAKALKDVDRACRDSCHFRAGFTQAFEDLALGGRPVLPAAPPPKYWSAYYRSCRGRPAVSEWYAGYAQGLSAADAVGVTDWNRIVLSPTATPVAWQPAGGWGVSPFAGGYQQVGWQPGAPTPLPE